MKQPFRTAIFMLIAPLMAVLLAGCSKQAPPMDSSTIAQHQAKKADAPHNFH